MAGKTQYGIYISDEITLTEEIPITHQIHLLKDAEVGFAKLPSFTLLSQSYSDQFYNFHSYRIVASGSGCIPLLCEGKSTILLYMLEGECQLREGAHYIKQGNFLKKEISGGRHNLELNPGIHSLLIVEFKEEIASLIEEGAVDTLIQFASCDVLTAQVRNLSNCANSFLSSYLWRIQREVIIMDIAFQSLALSGVKFKTQKISNRSPVYDTIASIRDYIVQNADQKISIAAISRQFNLASDKLQKVFLEVFEQEIKVFIRTTKMNKAKELLLSTNKAVEEIAWELGFESSNGFSRNFIKHFQQSPSQFRQVKELKNEVDSN